MPPIAPHNPPSSHPPGAAPPKGIGAGAGVGPLSPPPSPQRLQVGDIAGTMRLPWALLCLWLLAGAAEAARARTRRELAPGLYEHGVYDAGGSYCQRGDVCCHGRDDGCTVPYLDTICYCDLFCNRTVSDCCPDFWEYCLGIPAPFPKAQGEAPLPKSAPLMVGLARVPDVLGSSGMTTESCWLPQSSGNQRKLGRLGLGSQQRGWSSPQPDSCSSPWGRKDWGQRWGAHLRAEPGRMVPGCPGHVWGTVLTSPGWQPWHVGASRDCPRHAAQGSLSSPRGAEPAPGISGPFIPAPPGRACEAGCAGQPQA